MAEKAFGYRDEEQIDVTKAERRLFFFNAQQVEGQSSPGESRAHL